MATSPDVTQRLPDVVARASYTRVGGNIPPAQFTLPGLDEQPTALVVDQLDPAVGVQQQQPLPDAVEDRFVELVHPGQLLLAEPVGLAPQPSADQPRTQHAGHQQAERDDTDAGHPIPEGAVDALQGDADRDQRDDLPVRFDGDHRAHAGTLRAGLLLG
jgi:hypothetical protein